MERTILIVDDEPGARYALRRVFDSEHRVLEAGSVAEARERIRTDLPDVILLDNSMPGEQGMALLNELGRSANAPAIVMITGQGSERIAVEAMKAGAYDYLTKPYDVEELRMCVSRAMERQELRDQVQGLRERLASEGHFGAMVGSSAGMRELFQAAERVAQTDMPVMLLGESGTGKDLLAQEIHSRSLRAKNRFVALNCAALPETLVESELFGFEKGAFTGAVAAKPGKFELAHHGTLFMDEIGDMAPGTQAKILRAAESGTVERIGGSRGTQVDVRLLSATNKNLMTAIREGRFREDLFYRLGAITLHIPALRERRDDIPLLVDHFWTDLKRKYKREGPELTTSAILRLNERPWPGNVRELRSTLEKIFVLCGEGKVTAESIAAHTQDGVQPGAGPLEEAMAVSDYREARRLFEIEYLSRKLREHGGNVTRTASAIGIERQSLQEKMRKLGGIRESKG